MFKSKFKFYFFLLICCTLCLNVNSEDTAGECILKGKDGKELVFDRFKDGIPDNSVPPQEFDFGQNVTAGTEVESVEVKVSPNNGGTSKYVSASLDTTTRAFKLFLADDFSSYVENESETDMEIGVILNCGATKLRPKVFKVSIKDTYSHPPKFLEDVYEFELPMPFPKGMNLAPFGKSGLKNIVAKDVDLTNSEVTFKFVKNNESSTDEDLFSIEWDKKKDGKMYTAVLKTAKDLNLEKEISLSVQSTDNGKPPKSSSATIKIRPIKAESVPKFSSVFYSTTCEECKSSDSNAVIIPFKPEIQLSNVKSEKLKIVVVPENAELKDAFTAEIKNITVQLSLKLPANFKDDYIFATVTASQPGVESKAFAHIALSKSQPVIEESSNGGLIAATVILSILLVGLLIGAAYYYNKLR